MIILYMKTLKNVNKKNIDKFKNCVIELNFNNILITYNVPEIEQMGRNNGLSVD